MHDRTLLNAKVIYMTIYFKYLTEINLEVSTTRNFKMLYLLLVTISAQMSTPCSFESLIEQTNRL